MALIILNYVDLIDIIHTYIHCRHSGMSQTVVCFFFPKRMSAVVLKAFSDIGMSIPTDR